MVGYRNSSTVGNGVFRIEILCQCSFKDANMFEMHRIDLIDMKPGTEKTKTKNRILQKKLVAVYIL
jgi:hypothetical protein